MKKLLFVLMALAIATPAMAAKIVATDETGGIVRIDYVREAGDAQRVRAMGLDLTITSGNAVFDSIVAGSFKATGASTAADKGYGIFPGTIAIDSTGTMTSAGSPKAPDGSTGENANGITLELGSLFVNEANAPVGATGTVQLCKVKYTGTITSTLTITGNAARGNVVNENGTNASPTYVGTTITFQVLETISTPAVTKTTAAPAAATRCNSGRLETFVASATSNLGHALQYQFTWGDGVVGPWGAATQTHTYTYTAAATYNVTVLARCAADTAVTSTVSAPLALATEAVKSTAAYYTVWGTFGRPACWAFKKQCNGDAEGTKELTKPVMGKDLTLFKAAYNKTDAVLQTVLINGIPGICADFEKTAELTKRVMGKDLAILKLNYNKADGSVLVCPATNLHYYTN